MCKTLGVKTVFTPPTTLKLQISQERGHVPDPMQRMRQSVPGKDQEKPHSQTVQTLTSSTQRGHELLDRWPSYKVGIRGSDSIGKCNEGAKLARESFRRTSWLLSAVVHIYGI